MRKKKTIRKGELKNHKKEKNNKLAKVSTHLSITLNTSGLNFP